MVSDPLSRKQIEALEENCAEFGIPIHSIGSERQGIVHVIGPELGVTQPGMTIVCGDSHTSTHGAFGALAFGIGTSEVEHVLATQTLPQRKPRSMRITYAGELRPRRHRQGPDPRHDRPDRRGRRRGPRHRVLRAGDPGPLDGGPHDRLQHDDRGRRPRRDDRARRHHVRVGRGPPGRARATSTPRSRTGAACAPTTGRASTREVDVDAADDLAPGELGHQPGDGRAGVTAAVPRAAATRRATAGRSSTWASRRARRSRTSGSTACSSARAPTRRIGDLRAAAEVVEGRTGGRGVDAMVVPGSAQVKAEAEAEGLDEVFGPPGSSGAPPDARCASGMNPDILHPGERCASTSNRNFEGRQGRGGRTHLGEPADGGRRRDRGTLRRHPGVVMKRRECDRGRPCPCSTAPDVDTDQIMPKQFLKRIERTGFGEFLFYDWAKEPGWDLPSNPILVTGPQLRLRLLARARPVGARGLRLPGGDRAELRRHLLLELHQDRAAPGGAVRGRGARGDGRRGGAHRPGGADRDLRRRGRPLRDRPGDQATPARRPRRHRRDAAERGQISAYERERERRVP